MGFAYLLFHLLKKKRLVDQVLEIVLELYYRICKECENDPDLVNYIYKYTKLNFRNKYKEIENKAFE